MFHLTWCRHLLPRGFQRWACLVRAPSPYLKGIFQTCSWVFIFCYEGQFQGQTLRFFRAKTSEKYQKAWYVNKTHLVFLLIVEEVSQFLLARVFLFFSLYNGKAFPNMDVDVTCSSRVRPAVDLNWKPINFLTQRAFLCLICSSIY